jgi:hypothetical protein
MHDSDVLSNIMFCRGIALAVDGLMEILPVHVIATTPGLVTS